jgi:hypothetical protein
VRFINIRVKGVVRVGFMVRDNPKLLEDSGEVPKPKGRVGGSIPGCEIISLLDGKLTRWSSTSCVPKKRILE